MKETKRAVVVGTRFGLRVHVPALRAAGFEVVALVGGDSERTRRRADRSGIALGTTSLQDAIDQTSPDVVTVATPPHTHHELVMCAIEAGAHVVCEKPMAVNGAQAAEMTAAAKDAGVVALIGTEFRWDPPVAACSHALNQGFVGRPHTATVVRSYSMLAGHDVSMPDWWFDKTLGGGWLAANGAHVIDQLQMWLGPIAEVCATTKQVVARPIGTAEDSYELLFRTTSGVSGILQESAASWGDQVELTMIAGSSGTLTLDQGACVLREASGSTVIPSPWTPPTDLDQPTSSLAWTGREIDAYVGLTQWLRRAIDGEPQPVGPTAATFADGLSVMRVVDAAHESAADHRWVTVQQ